MIKFLSSVIKSNKNNRANREHIAVIEAIIQGLETLDRDTATMKLELMILTASGRWLDTWGEWFGVIRLHEESDEFYSKRIIATTIKPKNTIPAIIDSVNEVGRYEGNDTSIFEPHKFVARYNVSEFSGKDRFQNGDYWRAGVIDINTPFEITNEIIDTVNIVKSAGIKVYYTYNNNIWTPDDDEWGFKDKFIPYAEYLLKIEPALAIALKGAVFSMDTRGQRTRSGKQTLWGTFVDYCFDVRLSRNFERYMGESVVLSREDFVQKIPKPVLPGQRYSKRLGTGILSGGKRGEFDVIDLFEPEKITDLQGDVAYTVFNLRPATRSHHGVFSGQFGLSGAPDNGWVDKPYIIIADNKALYEYPSKRVDADYTLESELAIKPELRFNKSRRSGRQILFVSDLAKLQTDLTMSEQKRVLTFEDPYKWVEFLYAIKIKDEALYEQLIREATTASDIPLEQVFEYDSTITVDQLEEWGLNVQSPVEVVISS